MLLHTYSANEVPGTNRLACSFFSTSTDFLRYVITPLLQVCMWWSERFHFFKLIQYNPHEFCSDNDWKIFTSRLWSGGINEKIDKCTRRFGLNVVCLLCDHFWPRLHHKLLFISQPKHLLRLLLFTKFYFCCKCVLDKFKKQWSNSSSFAWLDVKSKCRPVDTVIFFTRTMYDFHDSTDILKFWAEKWAINKTFLFFIKIR